MSLMRSVYCSAVLLQNYKKWYLEYLVGWILFTRCHAAFKYYVGPDVQKIMADVSCNFRSVWSYYYSVMFESKFLLLLLRQI